ncbi:hypothetical protein [Collimonas sp. OK307]|uniref:hypothetical protein n=1 Tax=Collimonas sp. OK307 TaxID=1801620 RepID=UPI0011133D87|nr:hypothetical protein [Collimonas sp. OK307]
MSHALPENEDWLGRATACVDLWDRVRGVIFKGEVEKLVGFRAQDPKVALHAILTTLHQVRTELRLSTVGPLTVAVGATRVFDYYNEVRKVIETSNTDIFFVDPYLDAEFVSRYLPHVSSGTTVRLLGYKCLKTLVPALELFKVQERINVELRVADGFHDRYIFIDHRECYQSGASFKDAAKKAPATLTQITDAFAAVSSIYEAIWASATVPEQQ